MKQILWLRLGSALVLASLQVDAQIDFDTASSGPWLSTARTTLVVPKVSNNSITLDGFPSDAEYGGFPGITVIPSPTGSGHNGWILDFPGDNAWDGPADSSFTFFLAHDDNYLYVGVKTQDDIVNSDNVNSSFWSDDAIELVIDALADGYDDNTDNDATGDQYGGHNYLNYQGRFSGWDDAGNTKNSSTSWANAVDWKYGKTNEVFGFGKSVTGGWQLEARFRKSLFENPLAGNKLRNGYRMGFNIGLDDDDKHGPLRAGGNGDGTRSQDLEIQYFWANRARFQGYNADYVAGLTADDIAHQVWRTADTGTSTYTRTDPGALPSVIDSGGRLSHGGAGEIIFGYDVDQQSSGKILFVTSNASSPGNIDPYLIALFQAKGYQVNLFNSDGRATEPDELRAAAATNQVVFISETIGSTTVAEPPGQPTSKFALHDTDVPVISFEAFMFDNAGWVKLSPDWATSGANDFIGWGNTARTEVTALGTDPGPQDSLYIRKPGHAIAGGLTGKVKVYNFLYSFNFGLPSAGADVIASVNADGTYPTLWVYDKGKTLSDGTVAPNKRIGLFLGQTGNPDANFPPDSTLLSEAGRTLLLNTVAYAIGTPVKSTLSIAHIGNSVSITYSGGTLQSGPTIKGPWSNEPSSSPFTIPLSAVSKFYRVLGN
jgi:hypothetical protein